MTGIAFDDQPPHSSSLTDYDRLSIQSTCLMFWLAECNVWIRFTYLPSSAMRQVPLLSTAIIVPH
jgi:hypothetical protein